MIEFLEKYSNTISWRFSKCTCLFLRNILLSLFCLGRSLRRTSFVGKLIHFVWEIIFPLKGGTGFCAPEG